MLSPTRLHACGGQTGAWLPPHCLPALAAPESSALLWLGLTLGFLQGDIHWHSLLLYLRSDSQEGEAGRSEVTAQGLCSLGVEWLHSLWAGQAQ